MQKKYFPSPSKQSTRKLNVVSKKVKKRFEIIQKNNGKSLRKEFDLIIKLNYSMLTAREVEQIWHTIGTQIAQKKSHIGSLKNLIINSIRLTNNSH
jgi:hypothetical protein